MPWPIWDLAKFSTTFKVLQSNPKPEDTTLRGLQNAFRDIHFLPTRVSGVCTLTLAEAEIWRSIDGSILGSGAIPGYTKHGYCKQLKEVRVKDLVKFSITRHKQKSDR